MQNHKFVFFGTPDVASKTLEILKSAGYIPTLIVTAIDKPQGRKMIVTPPPAKIWAIENNIPYIQPEKIKGGERSDLLEFLRSDLKEPIEFFLVVAYGKILPEELIKAPRLGSINIHYSLLPKYRGASPVESAILNGDTETGVSIQQMEFKMDAGPILAEEKTEIGQDEKTEELRERLIKIGGELLVKTLPNFLEGKIVAKEQVGDPTFCKKIKKEDGLIDLATGSPSDLYNKFRAYHKWPRIYYFDQNGKRIIITDAELRDDKFVIRKIIPEGGKEQTHKV